MLRRLIALTASSVIRQRRTWTLGTLLLLSVSLWAASHLGLSLDPDDFLPVAPRPLDPLESEILDRFGRTGRLIVFLESGRRPGMDQVAPILDYLATRIETIEGVQAVQVRVSAPLQQFLDQHGPDRFLLYVEPQQLRAAGARLSKEGIEAALLGESNAGSELPGLPAGTKSDPLGLIALALRTIRRVTGTSRVRLTDGYYSLPGGRKFFFIVEPEPGIDDIEAARALVHGIEDTLESAASEGPMAELLQGKRLFIVGRLVSYVYSFDTLFQDVRRVIIAATILVLVLLVLFFRRPVAPLTLLLPIASGLILTGALGYFLFRSVSLVAWIFAGLIVGMGVDFGLHIGTHYWVYAERGLDKADALASAVLRPGRAIVFAGLTSAAAFFSLQVVSYPVMKHVAWMTAIALLAIVLSSFIVLPIALSRTAPATRPETLWHRWGALIDRASRARTAWGFVPWGLLILATLIAVRSIPFEPHPWKLALRGNPRSADLDRLNKELGSAFTPLVMVSRGKTQHEAIARDREATLLLQRIALGAGITTVESVTQWLPSRERQAENIEFIRNNRELFSPQRFARDFEEVVSKMADPDPHLIEDYLPLISRFLQRDPSEFDLDDLRGLGLDSEIDRHLLSRRGEHAAISYIYLKRFPWAEGSVSRFLEVLQRAGGDELAGVRILGDALRSAAHADILRRDALLATLVALTLVAGILWLQFRNMLKAALCLVPLVCGICAALLVMAAMKIELNMLTLAIAPLIVGIGVDDGVHMVERLHSGEELGTILRETGSAMTMTTLTTIAAFACLGLATFDGVRELGLVGSFGLLACLLASLHLIPLCHRFATRPSTERAR